MIQYFPVIKKIINAPGKPKWRIAMELGLVEWHIAGLDGKCFCVLFC